MAESQSKQPDKGEDNTGSGQEIDPAYLVIDYGEQLLRDLEETRNEIQKEIISVIERINRLWAVQVQFMIVSTPILLGLLGTTIMTLFLPNGLAAWMGTILMSLTLGVIFLCLTPFSEALGRYQDHDLYNPFFRRCECRHCDTRIEKTEPTITNTPAEDHTEKDTSSMPTGDTIGPQCKDDDACFD